MYNRLPVEIVRHIYNFDRTYHEIWATVMKHVRFRRKIIERYPSFI